MGLLLMSDQSIIQPPPFGTVEQADAFIRNHELSSNEKFVIKQTRTHNSPDISSVKKCNIRWEFNLASGVYCDGIPYIIIADQLRHCQYGPAKEKEGGEAEEEYEIDGQKRKRGKRSKKINCPAKVWMKTIMKFPEYKVDLYDGTVRRCDKKRISHKLKREFDEDSQSFTMVFVQILNKHEHDLLNSTLLEDEPSFSGESSEVIEEVTPSKPPSKTPGKTPSKSSTKVKTEGSKPSHTPAYRKKFKLDDKPNRGEVLKKGATLKGKNLMKLALEFKAAEELPYPVAQPKLNKTLDCMTDLELISLYHDITGEMPNEMFAISGKEFNMPNMWMLIHLCITTANAEIDSHLESVVHQSIRIKGTEQIFSPVMCEAIACASVGEHMHCPLCSSCEAYTNSSLLKKHFLQKHVLNSIEFAGLKFLRCLDGCGVEDATDLKDGHWHCWKCKSCHKKERSCLKHFMVHLKGKEDNQQVHVLQNVNTCVRAGYITHEINSVTAFNNIAYEVSSDYIDLSTDAAYSNSQSPMKKYHSSPDGPNKRHHYYVPESDTHHGVIQNEQQNAVMYIQDDSIASLLQLAQNGEVVMSYNDETDRDRLRCIIRELEQKSSSLEKTSMIQRSRIQFLTEKNEELEKSMSELNMKYQDLLSRYETVQKSSGSQASTEDDKIESTSSNGTGDVRRFTVGTDGTLTKDSSNKDTDKSNMIKQCLDELKAQKTATTKAPTTMPGKDSSKTEAKGLMDIRKHLSTIKKDIEQLKIAALLTNQQAYATQNPMMIVNNQTANLISTNQQLLLDGLKKEADTTSASPTVTTNVKPKSTTASSATVTSNVTTKLTTAGTKSFIPYRGQKIVTEEKSSKAPLLKLFDSMIDKNVETEAAEADVSKKGKLLVTKKDNTVFVALKSGSSCSLSKTEIEDLVNSAVQKMNPNNPGVTSTVQKTVKAGSEVDNTKTVSEVKEVEIIKAVSEIKQEVVL